MIGSWMFAVWGLMFPGEILRKEHKITFMYFLYNFLLKIVVCTTIRLNISGLRSSHLILDTMVFLKNSLWDYFTV